MSDTTADTMHSAARGLEFAVGMIRKGDMPQASAIANVARLCDEAGQTITRLQAERDVLLIALHDAIRRPMGVVPASADPFYNPVFAAQAEVRRIEKEAAMIEGVGG